MIPHFKWRKLDRSTSLPTSNKKTVNYVDYLSVGKKQSEDVALFVTSHFLDKLIRAAQRMFHFELF